MRNMKNINKLSLEDLVVLSARRGIKVDIEKVKKYYKLFDEVDEKELDEFYIGFLLAEAFPSGCVDITKELVNAIEGLWFKYYSFVNQNALNDIHTLENTIDQKNWS